MIDRTLKSDYCLFSIIYIWQGLAVRWVCMDLMLLPLSIKMFEKNAYLIII